MSENNNILSTLKSISTLRATGNFSDYDPEGAHKDTIYFAKDDNSIWFNGKSWGGNKNDDEDTNLFPGISNDAIIEKNVHIGSDVLCYDGSLIVGTGAKSNNFRGSKGIQLYDLNGSSTIRITKDYGIEVGNINIGTGIRLGTNNAITIHKNEGIYISSNYKELLSIGTKGIKLSTLFMGANKGISISPNVTIGSDVSISKQQIDSINNKVDKVNGKGLSTYDFNLEWITRLANTGLYGRLEGTKYGVSNIWSITKDSTNEEIKAALTSSTGKRLLETDLLYCAENGTMIFDERTYGWIMVNKCHDGMQFNLIEINSPRFGVPEVTSWELPSIRLITLVSRAEPEEGTGYADPETAEWKCTRVINEKIAYRSDLDRKLDKQTNLIYTQEIGGTGITIFYNVSDEGVAQPLTMVTPTTAVQFYGQSFINTSLVQDIEAVWKTNDGVESVYLSKHSAERDGVTIGNNTKIGAGVTIAGGLTINQALFDGKVDKVNGKGLSTNDFTTALKNKLDGLGGIDKDIYLMTNPYDVNYEEGKSWSIFENGDEAKFGVGAVLGKNAIVEAGVNICGEDSIDGSSGFRFSYTSENNNNYSFNINDIDNLTINTLTENGSTYLCFNVGDQTAKIPLV